MVQTITPELCVRAYIAAEKLIAILDRFSEREFKDVRLKSCIESINETLTECDIFLTDAHKLRLRAYLNVLTNKLIATC